MCFIKFPSIEFLAFWRKQSFVKLSNEPRKLTELGTCRHKKFQSIHLRHHIEYINHLDWETETFLTHIFYQYQIIYSYRKKSWLDTLKLLQCKVPGESHGQRSLAGYHPWSLKDSYMTEHTHDDGSTEEQLVFGERDVLLCMSLWELEISVDSKSWA